MENLNPIWPEGDHCERGEVAFDADPMRKLIVDEERKSVCTLLIGNYKECLLANDVVAGKGSGLIFLLHGPPGVGKTLTAEAVAEYLKKPL